MIEKRYLRDVLSVAESDDGKGRALRLKLIGYFAALGGAFVVLPYCLGIFRTQEYFLLGGMLVGAMTMRLSTTYRFRYLVPFIDIDSIRGRLEELDT